MKEEPLFTIKETFSVYSKKKGAYDKTRIVAKRVTWEEVLRITNEKWPGKKMDGNMTFRTSGLLYPGSVKVTQLKK